MREVKNKKVLVAMSGGVDSSVAAAVLKSQGYEIIGIFLKFWKESKKDALPAAENKCCTLADQIKAKQVARQLGIPFQVIDFSKQFKKAVVDDFIWGYKRGVTPNPCVLCNQLIKFGELVKLIKNFKADYVATGHYARVIKKNNKFHLLKARDKKKDQSYFLYRLNQTPLKHILFPIGDYTKDQVFRIAKKFKLPTFSRGRQSQDVCFYPESSPNQFLTRQIKDIKSGLIKNQKGTVVGQHRGLIFYTIGQRTGLNLKEPGPFYVFHKDLRTNTLWVTNNPKDKNLWQKVLYLKKINWILGKVPSRAKAKIRYQHPEASVKIRKEKGRVKVIFSKAQRAITPGQSVVFYKGQEVLGGGIIV